MELEHARAEFEFEQELRELELEMMRKKLSAPEKHHKKEKEEGVFFLLCAAVHILMAIWVYQDVRKRNQGNGSWIVITLLAGFFGASVYALIRIGDCK